MQFDDKSSSASAHHDHGTSECTHTVLPFMHEGCRATSMLGVHSSHPKANGQLQASPTSQGRYSNGQVALKLGSLNGLTLQKHCELVLKTAMNVVLL
jgi:hypothetical protein